MTNLKIKICGMRYPENIREVAALQPDYLGFIFYAPSPRFVGMDYIIPELVSSIKRVGVFVNETEGVILDTIKKMKLDAVQLHGAESPAFCAVIKSQGVEVVKAFSVDDTFNFERTTPYENNVDFMLFDTKGKYYGGNALTFNWNVLERYNQKVPFFLSGGISADNVPGIEKLMHMNIHALDINSGVEDAPALKNVEKIKQLKDQLSVISKKIKD